MRLGLFLLVGLLAVAGGPVVPAAWTMPAADVVAGCSLDADVRPTALVGESGPGDLVSGLCPGIRPGAQVSSPLGGCTMSWILKDAQGIFYATIAGHCGEVGDNIRLSSTGATIGQMIYSKDQPIGEDFGVFRIFSNFNNQVNATLCAWGGPTSVWSGAGGSHVVRHFGFGLGVGSVPPARARTGALGYVSPVAFTFTGVAMPGDSGSPARLASGEALGVITDLTSVRTPGTGPLVPSDPFLASGVVLGTRLDHGLANAQAATGLVFTLQTGAVDNEPAPLP